MVWLFIRIALTVLGVGIGIFLALKGRHAHKGSYVGILIIALSTVQGLDAALSIYDRVDDYLSQQKDRNVTAIHILDEGRAVEAFNADGQPLWRRAFDGTARETIMADLNDDGDVEIVVGIAGSVEQSDTGRVIVLGQDGSDHWSYQMTVPYPYRGGSTNQLGVTDILVGDFLPDAGLEVFALASEVNWFAGRAAILRGTDGTALRDFWNPGRLHGAVTMKNSAGGRDIVLIHGYNNDLRSSSLGNGSDTNFMAVMAVDPVRLRGEAPPYSGNSGRGTHLWYSLVVPQGVKISKIETKIEDSGEEYLSVWTNCGRIFYLTSVGDVDHQGHADNANCPEDTRMLRIETR